MAQEKSFENRIKKFLIDNNSWYIKYWSGGGCTIKGIPDLLISCNGYFIAAEIKAPKGNPSELQLEKIQEIRKSGALSFVLLPTEKDVQRCKKYILEHYEKYSHIPVVDFEYFKRLIKLLNSQITINQNII